MASGAADGRYWFGRRRSPSKSALHRQDIRDVPVFIYGLAEPGGPVRYVGKSDDPRKRLRSHMHFTGAPRLRAWLTQLLARGERPDVVILHEVQPGTDAAPLERHFILLMSRLGPLLNRTGVERLPKSKDTTPRLQRRRRHCRFCGSAQHSGSTIRPKCEPAQRLGTRIGRAA